MNFVKAHPGITISAFVFLFSITHALGAALLLLLWRMFTRVEAKVDKWLDGCSTCKNALLTKEDFKEWLEKWEPGRSDLWERVNHHRHDNDSGKVVIE